MLLLLDSLGSSGCPRRRLQETCRAASSSRPMLERCRVRAALALKPYDNLTYTLHTHALNISYALKHTPLLLSSSTRTVATTAFTVSIAVHSLSTNANIDDCRNKIAGYDSSPTSEWCCGKCSTTANCTTWVQWRPHNIDDAGSAKVQQTVGMWECTLTTRVGLRV